MSTKRTPPAGQGEGCASDDDQLTTKTIAGLSTRRQAIIRYYDGKGVVLSVPPTQKPKRCAIVEKRGTIIGWSKSSRRRMRLALITTQPINPEWKSLGVTLTVPGPVMELDEYRKLWDRFALRYAKHGISAIWRVEVQQRGALHYHMVAWAPYAVKTRLFGKKTLLEPAEYIAAQWKKCIRDIGPVELKEPYFGPDGSWTRGIISCGSRMAWPGADLHAVNIQDGEGARGSWLRYLQDHATKAKQEQIPVGIGRHWGIIGRKWLRIVEPSWVDDLTMPQYWKFLRAFQRLCRPHVKAPWAPFGTRLGFRSSRGTRGISTWFSRPDTISRIATWAKQD